MARRPRFGPARFRGGRGSRNRPRWTAIVDTFNLAAGATDESIVVAPADYRTATSLENEATFLRLRGTIQISNLSATLYATVVIAVVKVDEGFLYDPANQANLQNGDVLWSTILGIEPLAAASTASNIRLEGIDIKSKRVLSAQPEGEKITIVYSNVVGGGQISVACIARALLTLKL